MLYNPPLSIAVKNKQVEMASMLLGKGADPNARDHLGTFDYTALHHACSVGSTIMCQQLFQYNAKAGITNISPVIIL